MESSRERPQVQKYPGVSESQNNHSIPEKKGRHKTEIEHGVTKSPLRKQSCSIQGTDVIIKGHPLNNNVSSSISLDSFHIVSGLGRGSFGQVILAKYKSNGEYFAIKTLKKEDIIGNKTRMKSLLTEKKTFEVINSLRHPFLVNLFACFNTKVNTPHL